MTNEDDIKKRLDVLIRLMLEQQLKDGNMKRSEQLSILSSAGLTPGEIGKILGQASKNISSQLISNKKKKIKKSD